MTNYSLDGTTLVFDDTGDGRHTLRHTGELADGDWFLAVDAFANGFASMPSTFLGLQL